MSATDEQRTMVYDPMVFMKHSMDESKAIILTPEQGLSTDERWEAETDWLINRMMLPDGLIVDYGCGIGRMAKVLPNAVLGVDISSLMRWHADVYVDRARFGAVSTAFMPSLVSAGLRAAGAIAVWSLQHVPQPEADIALLHDVIRPGGTLILVNRDTRYVPVRIDGESRWFDDGKCIRSILTSSGFVEVSRLAMPEDLCAPGAYLSHFERV